MIRVASLGFSYTAQPLLGDLSFSVPARTSYAILGTTGCGKSTLLHLLAGLIFPQRGTIEVAGAPPGSRRAHSALILQDGGLLPWKTVANNVRLGLETRGVARDEAQERTMEMLRTLRIEHRAGAYPAAISGGERQRAALARALVLDPDLLLLDEASTALDAVTRERIQDLLLDVFFERALTMVVVTHSIEEAVALGGRIAILSGGSIRSELKNDGLRREPDRFSPEFTRRCAQVRDALVGAVAEEADGGSGKGDQDDRGEGGPG